MVQIACAQAAREQQDQSHRQENKHQETHGVK